MYPSPHSFALYFLREGTNILFGYIFISLFSSYLQKQNSPDFSFFDLGESYVDFFVVSEYQEMFEFFSKKIGA